MKLVLYDPCRRLYLPLLGEALRTEWRIVDNDNDPAWLRRELPDADALLALTLPADCRPLACCLKALFFPGAGYMHSRDEELPDGCVLANVFEHEVPVSEYVMLAALLHVTGISKNVVRFREGHWDGNGRTGGTPHGELWGLTLGLLGYGHIGAEVARRAHAFGMQSLALRQNPRGDEPVEMAASLADLMRRSDILLVACALTNQTRGLIGADELALLRDGALIINVARAEIVDEAALFAALDGGRISAALDPWWQYPKTGAEILHGSHLPFHRLPNVLPTPHLSAWTHAMLRRRMSFIAGQMDRLSRGEELQNVVLRGKWRSR